ncbi:hypothetical protein BFF78_35135 [Streptomyces fodineus]|uniref:Uncharacterized protein n=1 Tax=Streptomyces fodineus TaxID=1904616 RepID=A0A1D7YJ93_9ACTN|nr:hypothetical protein BFF78_35135 [Streptomyces fodineus]
MTWSGRPGSGVTVTCTSTGGVAVSQRSNRASRTATARRPGDAASAASIMCRTSVVAGTTGQRSSTSGQLGRCRKKQWSRRWGMVWGEMWMVVVIVVVEFGAGAGAVCAEAAVEG